MFGPTCRLRAGRLGASNLASNLERVFELANQKPDEARALFGMVDSSRLYQWVDEHISNKKAFAPEVGKRRAQALKRHRDFVVGSEKRIAIPGKVQDEVFRRDHFTCRFCGLRLISYAALKRLRAMIKTPVLRSGGRLEDWHPVAAAFRPSPDHVLPRARGGDNSLGNLVTACWICQFGRMELTLHQVDIEDPRATPPPKSEWDGFEAWANG